MKRMNIAQVACNANIVQSPDFSSHLAPVALMIVVSAAGVCWSATSSSHEYLPSKSGSSNQSILSINQYCASKPTLNVD